MKKSTKVPTRRPRLLDAAQLTAVAGGEKIPTLWKEGTIVRDDDWEVHR